MVLLPLLAGCLSGPDPGTVVFPISSAHVGRDYEILVHVPEGTPPEEGWPALYILDADYQFPWVQDRVREGHEHGDLPGFVLVGVGYGDGPDLRHVDYTPVMDQWEPDGGGAAAFHAFLQDELIPEVETRFVVSEDVGDRAIGGHSYGGLFASWALFQDPPAFRRFLAGSPSLPYANGAVLGEEAAWVSAHPERSMPARAYFTMGDGDGVLMALYLDELEARLGGYPDLVLGGDRFHGDYHAASWKRAYDGGIPFVFGDLP